METAIREIHAKGIHNPSGIVMCLYGRGFSGRFTELRKHVIKELNRIVTTPPAKG